jgi:hypothetical protein
MVRNAKLFKKGILVINVKTVAEKKSMYVQTETSAGQESEKQVKPDFSTAVVREICTTAQFLLRSEFQSN